jgi:hypothetical protein
MIVQIVSLLMACDVPDAWVLWQEKKKSNCMVWRMVSLYLGTKNKLM